MARLTKEQLDFLKSQGIPLSQVFDATGMGPGRYKDVMKQLGMVVAYGVSPCSKAEHRLKIRSGHCVQCKTANIAFQARFDDPGEVYVATSAKQKLIKVGATIDRYTRMERINAYGYGGASDWIIRHHTQYPQAGRVEDEAHIAPDRFRVVRTYNKDGAIVECQELSDCGCGCRAGCGDGAEVSEHNAATPPPNSHAKHRGEQYYAELELRILIRKIRHEPLEVQTAALSRFVIRNWFHREAARLYLKNLERHREAISRIGSWGFAEGMCRTRIFVRPTATDAISRSEG